ncbi:pyridoxamine 5'-phosphate oxidase family protein [Nocardia sp. BMG111209]|uniref:pyridoxamine 5'-phosphate oxidase family protein n=1 Tax=Nocardia sp. BMG111209 TaxID=1160137 RepID=UPI000560DA6D|nr:pyridoxamine 5'-phosphate oxidase family protein [Nocardia sp. BMG111209]
MSVVVAAEDLAGTLAGYNIAYLITVGDDARPHAVQVRPRLDADRIVVAAMGARTRRNAAERSTVTLLWPPPEPTGYTLLVDGTATVTDAGVEIAITHAVLHRAPADPVAPTGDDCGSDCRPVPLGAAAADHDSAIR